jgi:triacylglycerol lipase
VRTFLLLFLCAVPACGGDSAVIADLSLRLDRSPTSDRGAADRGSHPDRPSSRRPVLLVHGVNGSSKNFAVMIGKLTTDGWPASRLFAIDFKDPAWGCNVDNAKAIDVLVKDALAKTGATRVDLVAHSMGNLSSRYYLKNGGGTGVVRSYVSLGAMHHGLFQPCLSPLDVCVWKEICESGPFLTQLNAPPATPGPTRWASIYGTADQTVPNASSQLAGAENISVAGVTHDGPQGLLEHSAAYEQVKRLLLAD